uniref:Extra-large G-protein-like n=1 Tax=Arundo donax TaxID=35708 RepID=A0A0A9HQ42_ARUDO
MGTNEQTADERSVPAYCFSDGSHASQDKDLHPNLSESENSHPLGTNSEDTSQSRDLPSEANAVSHVPNLPHGDNCGLSPSEHSGVGGRSTDSELEKVILLTESCKQNSIKDVCVANEKQSPDNEFDDPECTEDALNVQKDADHTRVTKSSDSFLTNLIKRSFKINNGTRNGRARVYVNGFPISDRAVRKAEKLAGAICPGDYWYDYRAGFWGVMGRPCSGMIPPHIPEFNYPMPTNCAGGNTGIFVNGRELDQKDLDLLVARGLSDSPGRSYIVENSGKVSDEATGEELYDLGKLAPTVEKMRRGFGMRVPRVI